VVSKGKFYSLVVTEQCNLGCKYCYAGSKPDIKLDEKTALSICNYIIEDVIKNDITDPQVLFELGEPLLNFGVIQLAVNKLRKDISVLPGNRRFTFTIFSNLVLMEDDILDFIKKNVIYISTSLDGPEEVHDYYRSKSYNKVITAIEKIKKRRIPLEASAVVTKSSLKRYKEIVDTYLKLGLYAINFRVLDRIGFGLARWKELGYPASAFIDFQRKSLLYIMEKNLKGQVLIHRNFFYLFNMMRDRQKFELFSLPCNTIKKRLVFDARGDIFTCGEGKVHKSSDFFKIGNISTGLDSSKVERFWKTFEDTKSRYCKASNCEILGLCAPCLALNPRVNECNQDRCREFKAYFSFLGNLISEPRFYGVFLGWNKFVRNRRYLYKSSLA